MDTPTVMIGISAAVLLSYWFNHLGRVLRFPAVVFLLLTGLLLRAGTDAWGVSIQPQPALLSVLGTLGLILIVLEGALDLDLVAGRRGFLQRTFASAVLGVVTVSAVLAALLHLMLQLPWPAAVSAAGRGKRAGTRAPGPRRAGRPPSCRRRCRASGRAGWRCGSSSCTRNGRPA